MRMIRPKVEAPQITIAENQVDDFKPVTAAVVRHPNYPAVPAIVNRENHRANSLLLCFRPSDEERAKIAAGGDIYVSQLTFMQPMQGLILSVGPEDPCTWYGLEVER